MTATATKTGEHVGKKAGDKILKMLPKNSETPKKVTVAPHPPPPPKVTFNETVKKIPKKMTDQEINQRVNQIFSGHGIRKRKII